MTLTRMQTISCICILLDKDDCKDFCPDKRSVWVKSWLEKRAEQGAYHNLFQELLLDDAKSFKEFIRMDRLHFQFLVERLYPCLIKRDTVMRKSIKPDEKGKQLVENHFGLWNTNFELVDELFLE